MIGNMMIGGRLRTVTCLGCMKREQGFYRDDYWPHCCLRCKLDRASALRREQQEKAWDEIRDEVLKESRRGG